MAGILLELRVLILRHEHVSNTMLSRNVVVQLLVEHNRGCVKVRIQPLVLSRQIVVFLFVHLLVDNILLGDTQRTTSALLVNLRCPSCRFNACF